MDQKPLGSIFTKPLHRAPKRLQGMLVSLQKVRFGGPVREGGGRMFLAKTLSRALYKARECLYWPGMTGEIKNYVSTCEACRKCEHGQRKETLTSHETPSRPWQFVAADLFELNGKSYLVAVDYFSDFFGLDHLRSTSPVYVIKKLKGHFAKRYSRATRYR